MLDDFLRTVHALDNWDHLRTVMRGVTDYMSFRHFAVITQGDHRVQRAGKINLREYPEGASNRIIGEGRYRRDPVMRGSIFAEAAFLWSRLGDKFAAIITIASPSNSAGVKASTRASPCRA